MLYECTYNDYILNINKQSTNSSNFPVSPFDGQDISTLIMG